MYGRGGVGKTQLALEYAHRYGADYDVIWWIPSENPLTIPAMLARLARSLGLALQGDQEELADLVLDALRARGRWLLVFDNAEQPEELARWLPVVWSVLDLTESFLTGSRSDKRHELIRAERSVLDWETAEKQQHANACKSPAHCEFHRCRRRKRCTRQEQTAAMAAGDRLSSRPSRTDSATSRSVSA